MKRRTNEKRTLSMALPGQVEPAGRNLYLLMDGRRVARRGRPGTLQARTWVSLEPGLEAVDLPDGDIEVRIRTVH
jgi:hypothetical protein